MTLADLRERWERGYVFVFKVAEVVNPYLTLYVVLKLVTKHRDAYTLHRYFQVGDEWTVSVDLENVKIETVFAELKKVANRQLDSLHIQDQKRFSAPAAVEINSHTDASTGNVKVYCSPWCRAKHSPEAENGCHFIPGVKNILSESETPCDHCGKILNNPVGD